MDTELKPQIWVGTLPSLLTLLAIQPPLNLRITLNQNQNPSWKSSEPVLFFPCSLIKHQPIELLEDCLKSEPRIQTELQLSDKLEHHHRNFFM